MSDSSGTPGNAASQDPLSMRFPRQEHWPELPFPSSGDLLDPGIELKSPALAGVFFTAELPGKPLNNDLNPLIIRRFLEPSLCV